MQKKQIRDGIKEFSQYWITLPRNKIERKFEVFYRSVWLGFFALITFALREGVLLILALVLIALWVIYQMATGR